MVKERLEYIPPSNFGCYGALCAGGVSLSELATDEVDPFKSGFVTVSFRGGSSSREGGGEGGGETLTILGVDGAWK